MSSSLKIGDLIKVKFPRRVPKGHEQEGERPAIVIGIPDLLDTPRFPALLVIPLTTSTGSWAVNNKLYLHLAKGEANLPLESIALADQVLSVDITRIAGFIGSLPDKKLKLIKEKFKIIFDN